MTATTSVAAGSAHPAAGRSRRGWRWLTTSEHSRRITLHAWTALAAVVGLAAANASEPGTSAAAAVTPLHTVIVILENHSASQVNGEHGDFPQMPYLKTLAAGGALMTHAYFATTPYGRTPAGYAQPLAARPSQPNYLYLFSGNNQGVLPQYFAQPDAAATYPYRGTATNASNGDRLAEPRADVAVGIGNRLIPADMRPLRSPNLGAAVRAHGGSFASFSESLPYPAYDAETFDSGNGLYKRKHNPTINWIDLTPATAPGAQVKGSAGSSGGPILPLDSNLGFTATRDPASGQSFRGFAEDADGKPLAYDQLPTVAIVIPNQEHDAHDGSLGAADDWLRRHIEPYVRWAREHRSLLVITFDEDGAKRAGQGGSDEICTLFYGPMIKPGRYDEAIDHLNVLATLLALHADLDAFRRDFANFHKGAEAARELANLRPIVDIFDVPLAAGVPVAGLPPHRPD